MSMVKEDHEDICIRRPDYSVLVSKRDSIMQVKHHSGIGLLLVAVDCGDLLDFDLKQYGEKALFYF